MKDSFGCVCISTCTESQRLPDFTEKVKSRLPFHGFCFLENRFFTCPLYRRDREKALNSLGLNMGSLKLREYTNPTSSELWPHVLLATRGRYRVPVSRTRWHFGPSKQAVTGQEANKTPANFCVVVAEGYLVVASRILWKQWAAPRWAYGYIKISLTFSFR